MEEAAEAHARALQAVRAAAHEAIAAEEAARHAAVGAAADAVATLEAEATAREAAMAEAAEAHARELRMLKEAHAKALGTLREVAEEAVRAEDEGAMRHTAMGALIAEVARLEAEGTEQAAAMAVTTGAHAGTLWAVTKAAEEAVHAQEGARHAAVGAVAAELARLQERLAASEAAREAMAEELALTGHRREHEAALLGDHDDGSPASSRPSSPPLWKPLLLLPRPASPRPMLQRTQFSLLGLLIGLLLVGVPAFSRLNFSADPEPLLADCKWSWRSGCTDLAGESLCVWRPQLRRPLRCMPRPI